MLYAVQKAYVEKKNTDDDDRVGRIAAATWIRGARGRR